MVALLALAVVAVAVVAVPVEVAPSTSMFGDADKGLGRVAADECPVGVIPGTDDRLKRWPYINGATATTATILFGFSEALSEGAVSFGVGEYGAEAGAAGFDERSAPQGTTRLFRVTLRGLEPKTRYCYRLLSNGTEIAGGFSFKTPPAGDEYPVRFLTMGDYGAGTPAQRMIRDAMWPRMDDTDAFLGLGDNVYLFGFEAEWQRLVFPVYQEQWAKVPSYFVPGNHDCYVERCAAYLANFAHPVDPTIPAEDRGRYYSFDFGPVHFVALDSEYSLDKDQQLPDSMTNWLIRDLNATSKDWKIALYHKVPYNRDRVADNRIVDNLVPVFEEFGVQVTLGGHYHDLQVYPPQKGGVPTPTSRGGVTYITTGGGGFPVLGDIFEREDGAFVYDADAPPHWLPEWEQADAAPVAAEVIDAKYHFTHMSVLDECRIEFEFVGKRGDVINEYVVNRCE